VTDDNAERKPGGGRQENVVLTKFLAWLGDTAWSIALRESLWVYPIVETVHVLALALFLGLAILLDLRLLGLALRPVRVSDVVKRVMPWTWIGFALMVITGSLLFYADPVRFFGNVFFRIKAGLLVLAGLNAWLFHATVYRSVDTWDLAAASPPRARFAAAASLVLWAGVVTTGRMIAYNWW
jgi:hypothetical protein